ncbi:MAG: 5'-nucleotidase, lipoprotein e(P4) family [Pyrinomonadaceae bacterium]
MKYIFPLIILFVAIPAWSQTATDNSYQVGAVIYYQQSAEYRALAYQAFNTARAQIEQDKKLSKKLPKQERKKPKAVVVDIDETVLDNSPFLAKEAKYNIPFTIDEFYEWKRTLLAQPVPGALDFLIYAESKGFEVFYVSNVPNSFMKVTIAGLQRYNFPFADEEHIRLITDVSSKEPRRVAIAETHRIVLLIGDNLNDLSLAFENVSNKERMKTVDDRKNEFGARFIVLPNAVYGAWENNLYKGKSSEAEKKEARANALESY